MKLALRQFAALDANWVAEAAASAIKIRLVSHYCHGGIVIGEKMYHATAKHGVVSTDYTPAHWDLFDLGDKAGSDLYALRMVTPLLGAPYDWFSQLAFVLPGHFSDVKRWYCFELCWYLMTGQKPNFRVTPEMLLKKFIELRGKDGAEK